MKKLINWKMATIILGVFLIVGASVPKIFDSIIVRGSIGATADRVVKGWFTDLEVTNAIAGDITGNAGTVTTITGLAPDTATTQATQPNITTATSLVIDSDQVEMSEIGTATYDDVQDWSNAVQSAGIIDGGVITDAGSGTVNVSAIKGIFKTTNSAIGANVFFDIAGLTGQALTDESTNYIAVDYNGGTPQFVVGVTNTANGHTIFNVGKVFREGTSVDIINSGLDIYDFTKRIQQHHVEEAGIHIVSGAIVSATGTRNIAITSGIMYAGINRITTDAIDTSGADTFEYYYYTGAAWTESDQSQINNTQYNNIATGLATLNNNQYGVHWVYKGTNGTTYVLYGQGSYTLTEAQSVQPPSSIPAHVEGFGVLRAKIIIQKSAVAFTEIQSVADTTFSSSTASNHNELGGLQGGTTSQYYHLTSAHHTALTTSTQGDIWYSSATNTISKLAKGTATQVLAMNAGATAPEWVDSVSFDINGLDAITQLASDDEAPVYDTSGTANKKIAVSNLFNDIPTTDATTAYTLASADITVYMTSASANVVTVPLEASVSIPINKTIAVVQSGAGTTTITSVSGVTINGVDNESVVVSGQYGVVLLTKKATDDWYAQGIKITDPQFQTLTLSHTAPYITTENTTSENTDGGCESSWTANDHSSTALGNVTISHDGVADDTKGKIIIQTNNGTSLTDAVTIDSSQNVGIGTTSPSGYWANADDLVVSGTGARGISIISTDSNTCSLAFGDSTSTSEAYEGIIQYTHSSNSMAFWTGHTTRMTISATGVVNVVGEITAGTKTFKIDHPLDPKNKWLYHSVVESPEMRNMYYGQVALKDGKATVTMPDYWHALNGTDKTEFNYQLTCIGGYAQLYISKELENGTFEISGNADVKVSWQLSAIRHDEFAEEHRVIVEVDKLPVEKTEVKEVEKIDGDNYEITYDKYKENTGKGFYLHPSKTRIQPPLKVEKSRVKLLNIITPTEQITVDSPNNN